MKIMFLSDIHGDSKNLNIIEKVKPDEIICLGDIYSYGYYYKNENETDLVEEYLNRYKNKLICLKGNCDYENFSLFTPNDYITFYVDNIKIYCTHGHLYNNRIQIPGFSKGVLIYGHEHTPYIKNFDNKIFICVGSISKPRNNTPCSYLIYEKNTFTLYDINENILDQIKVA